MGHRWQLKRLCNMHICPFTAQILFDVTCRAASPAPQGLDRFERAEEKVCFHAGPHQGLVERSAGDSLSRYHLLVYMLLYNFLIQSPVIPVSAISHSRNHNLGKMNKTETPSDTFSELHSTIAIGLSPALVGLLLGIYSHWYFVVPALKYQNTSNQPPIVGYRSLWEPTWLVRLRFIRGSRKIIGEGYERVSYHNLDLLSAHAH